MYVPKLKSYANELKWNFQSFLKFGMDKWWNHHSFPINIYTKIGCWSVPSILRENKQKPITLLDIHNPHMYFKLPKQKYACWSVPRNYSRKIVKLKRNILKKWWMCVLQWLKMRSFTDMIIQWGWIHDLFQSKKRGEIYWPSEITLFIKKMAHYSYVKIMVRYALCTQPKYHSKKMKTTLGIFLGMQSTSMLTRHQHSIALLFQNKINSNTK